MKEESDEEEECNDESDDCKLKGKLGTKKGASRKKGKNEVDDCCPVDGNNLQMSTNDLILGNRGDGSGIHEEGEPTVFVD